MSRDRLSTTGAAELEVLVRVSSDGELRTETAAYNLTSPPLCQAGPLGYLMVFVWRRRTRRPLPGIVSGAAESYMYPNSRVADAWLYQTLIIKVTVAQVRSYDDVYVCG
ncbi:hypothetical protein EVAR_25891_1 [Eumeta japonica]|uniref:Uncharacterized protein n=1 Tax=Eumeta variegata TaxID=151549 RepID=A0A4C1W0W5_EUMVA|nr:hypothetical protein EVAR_25891_1 [Eumeta japonica]